MDVSAPEEQEKTRRALEQWRFDADDVPAVGPGGPEEQDRVLVEDYDNKSVFLESALDPYSCFQLLIPHC